ncbi:hypothetical protein FGRMN_9269 [Fusarium graminum]|nr:hypothetical protein FGRMN_9269 [Fusarium graminum]
MHLQHRILPDDILFSRLLELAHEKQDQVIVDDQSHGTQFSYRHILHGASKLLQKLQSLDVYSSDRDGNVFIGVLAPNGYGFIIAVLAVLAFGAVVVPMPTGALPSEAAYMLQQCNASYLLVGPEQVSLGKRIQDEVSIPTLLIESQIQDVGVLQSTKAYTLDSSLAVDEVYPSILFFTSGTTGPPKGVLHARKTINKYARMPEAGNNDEVCLIPSGAFWSVYFTKVFQMLLTGVRIEIQNFGRNYNLIWDKLREKTATKIVLSPTFWYGMMHYYQESLSKLPEPAIKEYTEGVQYLRDACATGAMPSAKLKEFWQRLRGRPLKVLYGSTETQEISICDGDMKITENDLGTPLPGVVVKLEGDEGELLVKTPSQFLGYLNCPDATAERFDADGFFKTGDMVTRVDRKLIFQGRANMDLFKFYTYKVPRTQVEASLTALSYILEGYILPVADPHCDTRVAALVRLQDGSEKVNLDTIRLDLSDDLPAYQLPTLLRVMGKHEAVPRTWSDKLAMRKVIQQFFPQDNNDLLITDGIQVTDVSEFMRRKTTKLWDLSGMRQ